MKYVAMVVIAVSLFSLGKAFATFNGSEINYTSTSSCETEVLGTRVNSLGQLDLVCSK